MTIDTCTLEYHEGDTVLEGYLAFDASAGPKPTVLIAHAWEGRDDFVSDKARRLAALGYNSFALDVYGKGVLGNSPEVNGALMQPLLDDRNLLLRRLQAGYDTACSSQYVDRNNIAIIGYCFGGLCALDLARSGAALRGAVSFHGLLFPPDDTETQPINSKIMILHGDKDPLTPAEQVIACQRELSAAGADWQLHTFGNALHSFTNPLAADTERGLVYNADADRRSWQLLQWFLSDIFA